MRRRQCMGTSAEVRILACRGSGMLRVYLMDKVPLEEHEETGPELIHETGPRWLLRVEVELFVRRFNMSVARDRADVLERVWQGSMAQNPSDDRARSSSSWRDWSRTPAPTEGACCRASGEPHHREVGRTGAAPPTCGPKPAAQASSRVRTG